MEKKICPSCGQELISGFIQTREALVWRKKKKLAWFTPTWFEKYNDEYVDLPYKGAGLIDGISTFAYHCPNCKTITIFYTENLYKEGF